MAQGSYVAQQEEALSRMRPDGLFVLETFDWLKSTAYELIANRDEPATAYVRKLEGLLKAAAPADEEQKRMLGILNYWLLQLKICAFWNFTQKEQVEFIQRNLVPALKEGLDVWPGLQKYFGFFAGPEMLQELADVFLSALSANQQPVGNEAAGGGEFRPTVSGWIGQYRQFLNKKYLVDASPAGVDLVTFLNTSPSAKRLSDEERNLIKSLLSLYNNLFTVRFNAKATIQRESGQPAEPVAAAPSPKSATVLPRSVPPPPAPRIVPAPPVSRPAVPSPSATRPAPVPTQWPITPEPATTPQSEQLKKLIREANFASTPSLSGAIVNAGMPAGFEPGKMRMGTGMPAARGEAAPLKPSVPEKIQPLTRPPTYQAPKPIIPSPPKPQVPPSALSAVPAKAPPAQQREPLPAPPKLPVVDLTRKPVLNLDNVGSADALEKITLTDVKAVGFETGLSKIKQKILDWAKAQNISVKQIANHFYRSPLYNLYVAMAVAVMNDVSGDQAAAFDKVMKTYQQSGKEYLTREQFMAVNRIKKELTALG